MPKKNPKPTKQNPKQANQSPPPPPAPAPVQPQAPPAVAPSPKKSKAGLIIVIILIVIIVLISGCSIAGYAAYRYYKNKAVDFTEQLEEIFNTNINTNFNLNENVNSSTNKNINKKSVINTNSNTNSSINSNANTNTSLKVSLPDKAYTTVTASSTLEDVTGIGFDYSPETVLDLDWSTAWTEDASGFGENEWIKLSFSNSAVINRIGIVPGYGREVGIYNDNNRLKTILLEFSDGTTIEKSLTDSYSMQILDFPIIKTDYLKIYIKSAYSGGKYDDTCIAEIDLWSDFVLNNDPDGAYAYYLLYYEPYALYPPEDYFTQAIMVTDIDQFGYHTGQVYSYSAYAPYMVSHVTLKENIPSSSTFICKWYKGDTLLVAHDVYYYGSPYIHTTMMPYELPIEFQPTLPIEGNWPLGDYSVEWFMNGNWVKTINFKISPQ